MKDLICLLFFIISVSLMVQVQNTNCSGFEQDDIDWNNFSPIVDLPDIDEHDDSGQRLQNAETLSSSPQQSQSRSQNTETLSSLSHHSQHSPVYSLYGDEDWNQKEMEDKFLKEVEYWKDVKAEAKNKTTLRRICTSFSWEYNESIYPKVCNRNDCYAMNYHGCRKRNSIISLSALGFMDKNPVMLSCHCYNQKLNGNLLNEYHFAVAKHSKDAYYLFKYESINNYLYLCGFVSNFSY